MQRRLPDAPPTPSPPPQVAPRREMVPRVLLTGFGPFPGIPVNASGVLVAEIAEQLRRRRLRVALQSELLPTEWKAGPARLQQVLRAHAPDIALHFGVAPDIDGFRLETMAENARVKLADACGHVPRRSQISAIQPTHLLSTFPSDAIRRRLEALAIPVELSADAGRYLCNAALFRSLTLCGKATSPRLAGFVHVPAALGDPEQAQGLQGFDWPSAIAGGLAIVETCLEHLAATRVSPVSGSGPSEVSV